jgi:hypothetical protein
MLTLEEKAMMDLAAEENGTMMLDPNTMDSFSKEWWDMTRLAIITREA